MAPRKKKQDDAPQPSSNAGGIAADQLRSFVDRIERLETEKKGIADDIKDVFTEAKGNGFDVPTMRLLLKLRKQKPHEREEQQSMLDLYLHAMGMAGEYTIAEQQGIDDASAGKVATDNPFLTDDPRHTQWATGWQMQTTLLATQDENQPAGA